MKPETSHFKCPACDWPLSIEHRRIYPVENVIQIFCGYGPCQSKAANEGMLGITEQDAYEGLRNAIEQEREKGRE